MLKLKPKPFCLPFKSLQLRLQKETFKLNHSKMHQNQDFASAFSTNSTPSPNYIRKSQSTLHMHEIHKLENSILIYLHLQAQDVVQFPIFPNSLI